MIEREQRRELGKAEHGVVMFARQAVVNAIEQFAVGPNIDRRALAAVAVAGLFSDLISNLASTPAGGQIVGVINQQIAQVGLQIVPVQRN